MISKESMELLFDECVVAEKIVWLAGNTASPSKEFRELFSWDMDPERGAAELKLPLKELKQCAERSDDSNDGAEAMSSFLVRAKKNGFFVKAYTPIPQDFHEEGGFSFSWGYTQSEWFYTEEFDDEFVQRLLIWKEEVVRTAKEKQA